jgi:hypothetical protein
MRLTLVAAALAVASLSSALSPAFAGSNSELRSELGIDITEAGNTHAEVQKFLAALEPETRRAVIEGCRHFLQEPVTAKQDTTVPFCKLAL